MYRARIVPVFAFLLFFLSGCSLLQTAGHPLSGTIEAEEIPVVAEVGGRIEHVAAEEGQHVKKGQLLAAIDKRTYEAAVREAEAVKAQAQAKRDEAKAGSRDPSIQKGIAAVQQADGAIRLQDARVKQAQAALSQSEEQTAQVESQWEGAKQTLAYHEKRLAETAALYERGALSQKDYEAQQEAVNQAKTQANQLAAQVEAARARVDAARQEIAVALAQKGTAEAQRAAAMADLELLREGSTDYAIRALLAAVEQADARLDLAKWQLEKTAIAAPADTVVLRSSVAEGEVAKQGAVLFTLMKADHLKLRVYIPEAELSSVRLGDRVEIKVDAYPEEVFSGRVQAIADKAEFTPKNVQTPDERTKLVFAVTIRITEGLDKLRPGMPADVRLLAEGEER
ncbi:HlyD family efflux transporter periplasmic adaptor subunit [Brevibacillus composti]|uniref:HlyD family efflux transporter periplasmic adaptor subunit n=1 Tax=Brevibacillus composti TaxID=2796470 RepID=A0A7T5EM57_9BACL|nr:HlyD family efflux transporter periplasmic adaptor subunit [Brevibacillus composti]QQE75096.1 HlyD family efflux transporter periplasmic adaptor subunit [Brevibacillus composti]QUO42183.1 HlyD family efflux transporter periplasmic adaptor subunit [Brevibacillus composti]